MPNLSYFRKDKIERISKKLERLSSYLKGDYQGDNAAMLTDSSQFLKLEKELQIQQAYLHSESGLASQYQSIKIIDLLNKGN